MNKTRNLESSTTGAAKVADAEGDEGRDSNDNEEEPPEKMSKSEELYAFLWTKKKTDGGGILAPQGTPLEVLKGIKRVMGVLECTDQQSSSLEKICQAPLTLTLSSIAAERSFSAVELFALKLPTRVNDDSSDVLFFLRCLLQNETIKKNLVLSKLVEVNRL